MLCGKHALNNLVQRDVFTTDYLTSKALYLDHLELEMMADNNEGGVHSAEYRQRLQEGSGNVDAQGNFSIQVLKVALEEKFGVNLKHTLSSEALNSGVDVTDFDGFICHKSNHWYSIRKIGGRFWNLNSILERPSPISHFQLATEIATSKKDGYTVFTVGHNALPKCGELLGSAGINWHKMSDLLAGKSTAQDAFEKLGAGLRLDGKRKLENIENLTEEEQIALAMEASLSNSKKIVNVPVPDEPGTSVEGAVRLQFRLPGGKRIIRRFLPDDLVDGIYAFCSSEIGSDSIELKYSFPPKDLEGLLGQKIIEAGIANETIQARVV